MYRTSIQGYRELAVVQTVLGARVQDTHSRFKRTGCCAIRIRCKWVFIQGSRGLAVVQTVLGAHVQDIYTRL
jgi:hypothetical protein